MLIDVIVTGIIFSISWKRQSSAGKTMMNQVLIFLEQILRWRMKHNKLTSTMFVYIIHFLRNKAWNIFVPDFCFMQDTRSDLDI